MEYRVATAGDIGAMVRLRKKLVEECGVPDQDTDGDLRAFFEKKLVDGSLVEWLCIEDGQAVASAAIMFYEFVPSRTNPSGLRGYVTNMYTAPEHRRKGIATLLLGKLVEEAKARGVQRLWLHATGMGQPVYLKFGFKETGGWLEMKDILGL